ncbi:PilZ domain-containing protein [uncultured Sphingomonas sp.]|uniref:PilZ domain-containing protein n=1 Tax=uncultured Sphingomonas sp. TaxID=158754 RepID=UPI0025E0573D|nr:PilZ domain-containing protein [uncultured Sphingomonas sp.]
MCRYTSLPSSHDDSRATTRRSVGVEAKARDRNGSRYKVRVIDLSRTGFKAECVHTLRAGTMIWLSLPGLQSLEAEVAWQRGEFIGAAFHQPLHQAVFDHVTRMLAA